MITPAQIKELEDFFNKAELPTEPVVIEQGWIINTPRLFIDWHISFIKASADKKWVEPYYNRLRKFANMLHREGLKAPEIKTEEAKAEINQTEQTSLF